MAYSQQDQDRKMLELLDEELEDALQRQEAQLELSVRLVFAPTGLNIRGKGIDLAEQLGLNGAQAFSLIERLVQDEYIRGKTERYSTGSMGRAVIYGLTNKGLALIGRIPHPNEELLESLDNIAAAIEGLQGAQPEQKTLARKGLGELKHFARGLPPEAASELAKQLFGGGEPSLCITVHAKEGSTYSALALKVCPKYASAQRDQDARSRYPSPSG